MMGSTLYCHAAFHKAIATAGCFLTEARAPETKSRLTLSMPVSQKGRLTMSQSLPAPTQVLISENPRVVQGLCKQLGSNPDAFSR